MAMMIWRCLPVSLIGFWPNDTQEITQMTFTRPAHRTVRELCFSRITVLFQHYELQLTVVLLSTGGIFDLVSYE